MVGRKEAATEKGGGMTNRLTLAVQVVARIVTPEQGEYHVLEKDNLHHFLYFNALYLSSGPSVWEALRAESRRLAIRFLQERQTLKPVNGAGTPTSRSALVSVLDLTLVRNKKIFNHGQLLLRGLCIYLGFASGSATMSTTLSSGEHGSNSNSITNSQESSSSTSNVFGSSNNQQSSTGNENRKCETMGLTNSRATRLSLDINREHQNARSGGRSYDYRVDLSRLLGASYTSSRGDSLQKGQTLNTVVKGFSQSFMASDTFKDTLKFFMETEGSLMMGTTHTRIYGAKMEMNKPPAFTDNFKSELQLMHTATMVVSIYFFLLEIGLI